MSLFDFCFNFTSSKFRDDEQAVLARALESNVSHFFMPGSDRDDSEYAAQLAEKYQQAVFIIKVIL